jgi:hypothetical protein
VICKTTIQIYNKKRNKQTKREKYMENNGISYRFGVLVKHFDLNASRLSKLLGGSTSKYYKLLDGDVEPNFETISAILNYFPNVSAEWFIRGNGSMFIDDTIIDDKQSQDMLKAKIRIEELEKTILKMTMERMGIKEGESFNSGVPLAVLVDGFLPYEYMGLDINSIMQGYR